MPTQRWRNHLFLKPSHREAHTHTQHTWPRSRAVKRFPTSSTEYLRARHVEPTDAHRPMYYPYTPHTHCAISSVSLTFFTITPGGRRWPSCTTAVLASELASLVCLRGVSHTQHTARQLLPQQGLRALFYLRTHTPFKSSRPIASHPSCSPHFATPIPLSPPLVSLSHPPQQGKHASPAVALVFSPNRQSLPFCCYTLACLLSA